MKKGSEPCRTLKTHLRRRFAINWIALLLVALFPMLTCYSERDTKVTVSGGNPPRFTMTGSGELATLRVGGPKKQRDGVAEDPYLYWVIEFQRDGSAKPVETLSSITYGEVPAGYVQTFPSPDQSPPPLIEDELYNVNVVTINANGARRSFAIHKGKVVIDPTVRDGKLVFPH